MTQTARRADPAPPHAGDAVVGHTARVWAWLCGVVAGLTGMAVADLLAYLVAPAGAPLPAVGSMIIELLPAGLVNWGKETLGTADKPVLLVIVGLGVLALCGLAGRLELRRPYGGGFVFAAVAAVGLLAVLTGGQAGLRTIAPTLLGLLAGYLVLRMLISRLLTWSQTSAGSDSAARLASRRTFLRWVGVTGVVAAVGAVAGRLLVATAGAVEEARSRFTLPTPTKRDPISPGTDLRVEGCRRT